MSNIEELPIKASTLTEFEALVAAAPTALDAIPGAVYVCDHEGWLVRYNSEAAALWGRTPNLNGTKERFCGSHRLFLLDGTPLSPEDCPMADAIRVSTEPDPDFPPPELRAGRLHRPRLTPADEANAAGVWNPRDV